MIPLEADEQRAYFQWVTIQKQSDWRYSTIFHVPNGAHLANGARSYAALKSIGLQKGVPDVFVMIPQGRYHGLVIEFKREGEPLRLEQKEWMDRLKCAGYVCIVCRNFLDAKGVTERWMALSNIPSKVEDLHV
jgi:hypothetical protein